MSKLLFSLCRIINLFIFAAVPQFSIRKKNKLSLEETTIKKKQTNMGEVERKVENFSRNFDRDSHDDARLIVPKSSKKWQRAGRIEAEAPLRSHGRRKRTFLRAAFYERVTISVSFFRITSLSLSLFLSLCVLFCPCFSENPRF